MKWIEKALQPQSFFSYLFNKTRTSSSQDNKTRKSIKTTRQAIKTAG